jgi:hypothetical protein
MLDRQAAVVERPSDDRPAATELSDRAQIVDVADPARGNDLTAPERDKSTEELHIGATQEPVPIDRCHLEDLDTNVGEALDEIFRGNAGSAIAPCLPTGEAAAHVDGDDDPRGAETGDEVGREGRVGENGRPDHGPGRTTLDWRSDSGRAPEPARHLDARRAPDGGEDLFERETVDRVPRSWSVEVDHMQPARPRFDEVACNSGGIVRERRFSVEVAALQTDNTTVPDVDRRQELEFACQNRLSVLA